MIDVHPQSQLWIGKQVAPVTPESTSFNFKSTDEREKDLTQKREQGHTFLLLEWNFFLHTREQFAETV